MASNVSSIVGHGIEYDVESDARYDGICDARPDVIARSYLMLQDMIYELTQRRVEHLQGHHNDT